MSELYGISMPYSSVKLLKWLLQRCDDSGHEDYLFSLLWSKALTSAFRRMPQRENIFPVTQAPQPS